MTDRKLDDVSEVFAEAFDSRQEDCGEYYVVLGKQLQSKNQFREAEIAYDKAIAIDPHLWEAYRYLARLMALQKQNEAVLEVYRRGIQSNPNDYQYLLALAEALASYGKWHYANLRYREVFQLKRDLPEAYLNWAKVLVELQQWEESKTATIDAIELKPDFWQAYHHLGKILQHQHQWQAAISAYKKVISLTPEFMHAYMRLAEIYRHLEQYPSALTCYHYVIDRAVKNSPVRQNAIAFYAETLAANPHATAQHYQQLGQIYRAQGLFSEAISAYQKAIQIDPWFQLPYISIQYTPISEPQLTELITFYRQLVKKYPDLALAWGNLGDALSQQNKIDEAIDCYRHSCYQKVIKLFPQLIDCNWQKPKQNAPDFLIVGAAKSGTSSLYNYLSYHPQILLPHKKELDFFGKNYNKGMVWYLAHFPNICDRSNFLTGEATPNYLRFPLVARRIKAHCPQTKIIILLRNPSDRAISWHYHKINTGLTTGSLIEAITTEIERLKKLDEAELFQGGYRAIDNIFSSLYYYQLKAWLDYLPREQFLILKSENFYKNTANTMKQVYNFIGIYPQTLPEYSKVNVGSYQKASLEVRQILSEYFKPYNKQLEKLLNLNFNWE